MLPRLSRVCEDHVDWGLVIPLRSVTQSSFMSLNEVMSTGSTTKVLRTTRIRIVFFSVLCTIGQ